MKWLPAAPIAVVLAALTLVPFARVLWQAIGAGLGPLATILSAPVTATAAIHTAVVALASTVIAGGLGGIMALLAGATDLPGRHTLGTLFILLMVLPAQVTTLAWITLLGPASPVLLPLGLAPAPGTPHPLFGPGGISLLLGLEHAPLVFLVLRSALRAIPPNLLAAARGVGAGPLRCLVEIVVPLAAPAFRGGLALAFLAAIGNFATPALLGIPGRYATLTILIYQRLVSFGPSALTGAAALSLVLLAVAAAGLTAQNLFAAPGAWRLAGGGESPLFALGSARRPVAVAVWALMLMLLAVPLAALVGTALLRAYGVALSPGNITLDNFRAVLVDHEATLRALRNSFLLSAMAAVILTAVSVVACHAAVRRRSRVIAGLLSAADLSYALPGTVLALACILLFIRPILGVSLYDSFAIILIAYLARFLTLAARPVRVAFRLLDPRIEDAAAASGAMAHQRLWLVVAPMILPAAASAMALVFLTAFNELTVSALLWSTGNETVGVVLFSLEQGGEMTQAAALGVVSGVIGIFAAFALGRDDSDERKERPGALPLDPTKGNAFGNRHGLRR